MISQLRQWVKCRPGVRWFDGSPALDSPFSSSTFVIKTTLVALSRSCSALGTPHSLQLKAYLGSSSSFHRDPYSLVQATICFQHLARLSSASRGPLGGGLGSWSAMFHKSWWKHSALARQQLSHQLQLCFLTVCVDPRSRLLRRLPYHNVHIISVLVSLCKCPLQSWISS